MILDRVGDFEVKRSSFWFFHRWSWMTLTMNNPNVVEFEGGWAHTRRGAEKAARAARP